MNLKVIPTWTIVLIIAVGILFVLAAYSIPW